MFNCKLIIVAALMMISSCNAQTKKTMTQDTPTQNPLICDPVEGICSTPDNTTQSDAVIISTKKPIKLIYFTDPICSSCWGIEPQLRKLKLEYGAVIEIEYRMGGLLPDWSYNSGGISKPSDVAHHWDEVSLYYDMPINGDIWLEDPLDSSYPPSIAFKAAQLQDKEKAVLFMRTMREMLFLKKKNIAKWEHIATAAKQAELDVIQLKMDFDGKAKALFGEDLKISKEYGVRGFPTIFFVNDKGDKEIVYGSKPYLFYETAILKLHPRATKVDYARNWEALFSKFNSLTAKEFAELSGIQRSESENTLNELVAKGKLEKLTTKNGALWTLKTSLP